MVSKYLKGSPEGSSNQEFRTSILCDVIETSWWLISRSIENLLKMTSPNFRVGSACLRLSPRLNSKVNWTPLWTILNTFARRFSKLMLWNCIIFTIFSTFCRFDPPSPKNDDAAILWFCIWKWSMDDFFYSMRFHRYENWRLSKDIESDFVKVSDNFINKLYSSIKMIWPCLITVSYISLTIWYWLYSLEVSNGPYYMNNDVWLKQIS